jgi:PPOX class probable F420-dependent enzyme
MKLDESARAFIGDGADATLVTVNPDGSPQVSVVGVALQSTSEGDELVSAHRTEYRTTRNIRRDPRVALTILSKEPHPGQPTPYLSITGSARIVEGGARELLAQLPRSCWAQANTSRHATPRRDCSPGSASKGGRR